MSDSEFNLVPVQNLHVKQVMELGEWLGFETRNKYKIHDDAGMLVAFAAEQQKGILGFLLRQVLGHWRKFDVNFYTPTHQIFMVGHHPFRWFFPRIEVKDSTGQYLGAIQTRFSILSKRFDIENEVGATIMEVSSPIWKLWTFPFTQQGRKVAEIQKKWSGLISEALTDRDNFVVQFIDPALSENDRRIVMASAVFIDLLYFEKKK